MQDPLGPNRLFSPTGRVSDAVKSLLAVVVCTVVGAGVGLALQAGILVIAFTVGGLLVGLIIGRLIR